MKLILTALLCLLPLSVLAADDRPIPSGKQLQLAAEKETRFVDTATLKKRLDDEPDLILIDIRTKFEIRRMGGTIDVPQNVNIVRGWLEFEIQSTATEKDTPIVVYCGGGLRSPLAAKTLQDMGYTNVANYAEGFFGWRKSGGAIKAP